MMCGHMHAHTHAHMHTHTHTHTHTHAPHTQVEHFSKYKLGEDESDGEEDEGEAGKGGVIKKPKTAEVCNVCVHA